jgi:hypothetical protein
MTHEAGKGDTQRPTDHNKYAFNYENIFRKDTKDKNEELRAWYTADELNEKKEGNDDAKST